MANENKSIDPAVVAELEQSKNEVLQRIAEKLKTQMDSDCIGPLGLMGKGHSSHSSGVRTPRGHNSSTRPH